MDTFVFYQGFNDKGVKILEASHTSGEWYDGEHPIIDDDLERVKMGIVRIKGHQFKPDGSHSQTWDNHYNSAGWIIKSVIRNTEGDLIRKCTFEYSDTGDCKGRHVWEANGDYEYEPC